jgi:hypothetical protein
MARLIEGRSSFAVPRGRLEQRGADSAGTTDALLYLLVIHAVRVSGAKKDILPETIALVRKSVPLQFENFRD